MVINVNNDVRSIQLRSKCTKITENDVPEAFASHFEDKVATISRNSVSNHRQQCAMVQQKNMPLMLTSCLVKM